MTLHSLSMQEFEPIFDPISLVGGVIFGILSCSILLLVGAAIRYGQFPFVLFIRGVIYFIAAVLQVGIAFFVFRYFFGRYEFDLLLSLKRIVLLLIVDRYGLFFTGAFIGVLLSLGSFLGGISGAFGHKETNERKPVMPRHGALSWN
jgi:hypothetical protein